MPDARLEVAHTTADGKLFLRCPNPVVEGRRYGLYVYALFNTPPTVVKSADGTVTVTAPDCVPVVFAPYLRPPRPKTLIGREEAIG